MRGGTAMSAEKGANIRQPFSPNTLPPTHLMPYFSVLVNCICLDQYFSADNRANIRQLFSGNTLPPTHHIYAVLLMQYFSNLLNCICPDQPNVFLRRKGRKHMYVSPFLPTPSHPHVSSSPRAVFLKIDQLYLSRPARCFSAEKEANIH